MKTDEMNEPAAAPEESSALPARREANPKNLERLLKRFDKIEKEIADVTALKERMAAEINKALDSGSVDDDQLVASLANSRGKLELIPAKLARLEAERLALLDDLQAEFVVCMAALERRLSGVGGMLCKKVVAFLQPLMTDDALLEERVGVLILPYTKQVRKVAGLISYIKFPALQGNWPEAARQWLRRENEADEIVAAGEAFAKGTK